MSNQNFFKFLNKRISTPAGILIIILVAIIAGGIMAWQYGWLSEELNGTKGIPPKAVPSDWNFLPESCAKNEDCGIDFCQQKGNKCIEIKYICEKEKCSSATKEFSNYICQNKKCIKSGGGEVASCEDIILPKIIDRDNDWIIVEQIYKFEIPYFFRIQPFDEKEKEIKVHLNETITYYYGEEWIASYKLREMSKNYVIFEYEVECVPPVCDDFEAERCNLKIYTNETCELYNCLDTSKELRSQY